jgi:hypothetical protein
MVRNKQPLFDVRLDLLAQRRLVADVLPEKTPAGDVGHTGGFGYQGSLSALSGSRKAQQDQIQTYRPFPTG